MSKVFSGLTLAVSISTGQEQCVAVEAYLATNLQIEGSKLSSAEASPSGSITADATELLQTWGSQSLIVM